MDDPTIASVIGALKHASIDLVVTLTEEPTARLTQATAADPFFRTVSVVGENQGIAICAGAALSGRNSVFVTGVAGLLVGAWALAQVGMVYAAPFVILASYRGDFGDHTGIPGDQSLMFKQVAEPLLSAVRVPYQILDRKDDVEGAIRRAQNACRDFNA